MVNVCIIIAVKFLRVAYVNFLIKLVMFSGTMFDHGIQAWQTTFLQLKQYTHKSGSSVLESSYAVLLCHRVLTRPSSHSSLLV